MPFEHTLVSLDDGRRLSVAENPPLHVYDLAPTMAPASRAKKSNDATDMQDLWVELRGFEPLTPLDANRAHPASATLIGVI
jgi:hypothetical protein